MKRDVRDMWVEALRSGEFSQTRNALKKHDGHCCLGVLCEIHPDVQFEDGPGGDTAVHTAYRHHNELPSSLLTAIELSRFQMGRLMILNDDEHMSFDQIAEHIEKNL